MNILVDKKKSTKEIAVSNGANGKIYLPKLYVNGCEKSMIRLTKLSKALKNVGYTAWIKKNHHDYILSDHFILKTNQDIKGSALTKLISLLGTVPNEDQGIQNRHNHINEMTEDEINRWLDLLKGKDAKSIYFTNLIHQTDKELFSIFKGEKDYIFLNKIYVDLIDLYEENIEIRGTKGVSPTYFYKDDEELMILPVRLREEPFYLKGDDK